MFFFKLWCCAFSQQAKCAPGPLLLCLLSPCWLKCDKLNMTHGFSPLPPSWLVIARVDLVTESKEGFSKSIFIDFPIWNHLMYD